MKNLRILCGINVRGLTDCLTEELCAAAEKVLREHSRKKLLLLVPDQYTMTAERVYLDRLGEKRMNAVRVLSFKRLASLFYANPAKRTLGRSGKSALLLQAYDNLEKGLRYYGKCGSFHFAQALADAFSDMKINRLTSDSLRASEKDKLCDLADIFDEYNRLLGDTFIDPDDRLSFFADGLKNGNAFENTSVFIDFFKVLNASEIGAVIAMLGAGADVTVTLKTQKIFENEDVFSPVNTVLRKLTVKANEIGCTPEIIYREAAFSENEALRHLEKNLFCADAKPLCAQTDCVRTYVASGRTDEVEMIAAEIASLVREKGMRYGDFAVVTRKPETYEAIFDTVFGEYDIPIFLHRKTPLRKKLPIRMLTDVLDAVMKGAHIAENLCGLAKTGLCGISAEDASSFEEYVRVWNLRYYSHFDKPFERSMRGFDAEYETDEDRAALARAEAVRVKLLSMLAPFCAENLTAVDFCTRAYRLFEACGTEQRLQALGELYERYGETTLYAENMQVYRLMLDTLDEIAVTGGERRMTASEFKNLILAAADSSAIGIIPTSSDTVLVGAADIVPLYGQKIVFVCGLVEGEFPLVGADAGLIDDYDRRLIAQKNEKTDSGLTEEDRYLYELFFTRFVLTTSTDRVVLSYPSVTDGECTASQAFLQAEACFESVKKITVPTLDTPESYGARIQREKPSFATYTLTNLAELKAYYEQSGYARFLREPELCDGLTPSTAAALFGRDMSVSYSRVDGYYRCRYHYFYEYGLNLHKSNTVRFDPANTGSFIHKILETVMRTENWFTLDDSDLLLLIEKETKAYFDRIFAGQEPSRTFGIYLDNQVHRLLRLFIAFREDLKNCVFVPTFFEQSVGGRDGVKAVEIALDGGKIRMTGKIDRIDVYKKDGNNYVRVIDYKTGDKTFDLANMANGIDIQLLMYLYALKENGDALLENIRPVGAEYISCKKNIVNLVAEEKKRKSAEEKTPEVGIYSDDGSVKQALGSREHGLIYIPDRQFDLLYSYVEDLMRKMGNELLKGHILRNPIRLRGKSACEYCDIKKICPRFEQFEPCAIENGDAALEEMTKEAR